jgi:DNA-directed RNA polymerase specialized sigma24 family protein
MAQPLMKQDRNKNLYYRPPNIEASINEALNQGLDELRRRAELDDRSPGHLPSECLVHLIRDAGRRADDGTMNVLLPFLFARCEGILLAKVPDDGYENAAEIREEVLGEFAELFANDRCHDNNNELDFYECRFNSSFKTLRIDIIRRAKAKAFDIIRREEASLEDEALPDLSDDSEHTAFEKIAPFFSPLFRSTETETPEDNCSFQNLLKEIDRLPPDERKAVVLCHILELEVESEDPQKTTAATLCGVTGRTIRNRLSRAAKKLLKCKEES